MTKTAIRISKGLDIPMSGQPMQSISDSPKIGTVGIIGDDYVGMKPTMLVQEGDRVVLGQPLFEDKKSPGVIYTAPGAGTIQGINRGAKRKFESIVIELSGDAEETFATYSDDHLPSLQRESVVENLVKSGLWTALRSRPYGKVPAIDAVPNSIFVTAMDTNPLAADPAVVLQESEFQYNFVHGLQVISTLSGGKTYLCSALNANVPGKEDANVESVEFSGPHPAGLPGTHIHFLDPVDSKKSVWHVGYQDVAAIGHLFVTGKLLVDRIVSLGGSGIKVPRLVRARLGGSIDELMADQIQEDLQTPRIISGSVLSGRISASPRDYLGRFHNQITVIEEGYQRHLLGWASLGFRKFSASRAFASGFSKSQPRLPFTTSTEGSVRAIVPIGMYEKVMPLDIIATPLMKALMVQDTETANTLGCLELDEEDLALCTFVCPGKNEYGPLLRKSLTHIEREG